MCGEQTPEWIKKKKCPSIIILVLFASEESKQDYVSLILFRIIPFTYASHLIKQHLSHSHIRPLPWARPAGRRIILGWGVRKLTCQKGCRVPGSCLTGDTDLGTGKPRFKWNTYYSATLPSCSGIRTRSLRVPCVGRSHLPESSATAFTKLFF